MKLKPGDEVTLNGSIYVLELSPSVVLGLTNTPCNDCDLHPRKTEYDWCTWDCKRYSCNYHAPNRTHCFKLKE